MAKNNVYPDAPSNTLFVAAPVTGPNDNKTLVFAGKGLVYRLDVANGAAITWLHLYDAPDIASVVVGTTVPVKRYRLAANADVSKYVDRVFNNGCVYAVTTTSTGSTGVATGAFDALCIDYHNQG